MPILNGDAATTAMPLLYNKEVLDHKAALQVLEKDYESRDGLDVRTLLDSTHNGALTYNDFLVLPGYIGNAVSLSCATRLTNRPQASPPLKLPSTPP
jgi:IMP dehydrogenase